MPRCTYCDLPTPTPPVTDDAVDGAFCCQGCLLAHQLQADLDAPATPQALPDTAATTFVHLQGMHCSSCEDFIETLAHTTPGIYAAEASYAADMAKISYDPDALTPEDLTHRLSRAGYTAALSPDAADDSEGDTVVRLIFGGFFGMMVMAAYIVLLYPAYLTGDGLISLQDEGLTYVLTNLWAFTSFVLFITGWPILRGAAVSVRVLRPNMDLLVALAAVSAYLYSAGAVLAGQTDVYFDVTVVIILAVSLGGYYERRIKSRAAGLLADLTREQVDTARRHAATGVETVPVEALQPGDRVLVRAGERIPIDGTVVDGRAAVDESLLTGESVPVQRTVGDAVLGGAVVTDHALTVRVDAGAASTLDRLVSLMWSIQSSRPGAQRLADRIAAVFVPLVIGIAAVAFGLQLWAGASWSAALLTGLAVLIVSCPCALGLATPLAVAAGVREAMQHGIVIRDVSVFEKSPALRTLALDKTGTLTTGQMDVLEAPSDARVCQRAAAVEAASAHPIARALVASVGGDVAPASQVESFPRGVEGYVDGLRVRVGHPDWLAQDGWTLSDRHRARARAAQQRGQVPVAVGWDAAVRGLFVVGDALRADTPAVLKALRQMNVRTVVLTGDRMAAARPLRDRDLVDEVVADVRPETKSAVVKRLQEDGPVAMVGDGSNDAPALAAADVGIAVGPTALAADAADVVIMQGGLGRVPQVFALARATQRRIRQNLVWAFLYNAVAIPTAALGVLNPLVAALAMAASSLGVVANSARSLLPEQAAHAKHAQGNKRHTPSGTHQAAD
ncbi:heavy metal translocating P-type ATPase [Salisaeta longa]|uniref:heavy metal translocating P-type ATPase n=1 Tax=Salisaeta longa TaxID=503170 RepID=UPI0003B5FACD|nr:cation-translocating P-type ATPase [Salisaeta longa]